MIARPKYNRTSKKWNIACILDKDELPLGHREGEFVKYESFDSKQQATDYINNREDLELKVKEG
ncbi:hypothetical protein [Clostridium luticellarii]|uniref:Uncharacterized protein n=1 Tax=Clostridium luticellarii TaxID=1691940 RepID=A0A2T0BNT7_9CLOT|nr:hypothetical protein [Clostridium luticellarii]PRR85541.1 hypothetical protein CLLU_14620 [Clostridium luticellarii]